MNGRFTGNIYTVNLLLSENHMLKLRRIWRRTTNSARSKWYSLSWSYYSNSDCRRPRDYEYRLKKWNYRQKLTESGWKWVGSMLDRRTAEGKQSQVLLSGVQISADKVLQRRHRHQMPTLAQRYSLSMTFKHDFRNNTVLSLIRQDLMSPEQPEDIPLRIRTPPPLEVYEVAWPEELPWIQFNSRFAGISYFTIISALQILTES